MGRVNHNLLKLNPRKPVKLNAMVFTPKEQHFAALSFLHFVIAIGYIIGTYYLLESTVTGAFHASVYTIVAILHAGVAIHGCATATKYWDLLTRERHSAIASVNLFSLAIKLMLAVASANWVVFATVSAVAAFNVLAICVEAKYLRTGVNPDHVEGHVNQTIYEWMRQWIINTWNDGVETVTQFMGYVGFDFL
uniref:Solute carrier family 40 protein n=1 Tax=Panagrellus redivivus TaxID=6233 RepID=A0A7E4WCJ3_PANRE